MSYEYTWLKGRPGKPLVTLTIIAINVIIYVFTSYQNFLAQISQDWIDMLSYVPALIQTPLQWYRILTSMFIHADIFHIFFNMWFLYFFGSTVERRIGHLKYLALYLASGLLAIVFHTSFIPVMGSVNLVIPALGASGAISGILGAYLLLFPQRRLSGCYFIFLIPVCFTMSAAWFLILWFATQVIYGYLKFGGVAFFAHAGGFVGGLALIYPLAKRPLTTEHELHHPIFIEWRTGRGLDKTAKLILAILLLAVIVGAAYATVIAPTMSGVYFYTITAINENTKNVVTDQAVYALGGDYIAPSQSDPRIVFNRLLWAGLLVNVMGHPQNVIIPLKYSNNNLLVPNYAVRISLAIDGLAMYDSNNVLRSFNGTIITNVINVIPMVFNVRVVVGEKVTYRCEIIGEDIAGSIGPNVIFPFAAAATLTSIAALYVVMYKDREVAEEETLFFIPAHL
jgi:membrane associated rhomboid family serine protease